MSIDEKTIDDELLIIEVSECDYDGLRSKGWLKVSRFYDDRVNEYIYVMKRPDLKTLPIKCVD
ncbi:hypothetical protein COV11_02120 [Candidatus Woesearchaeota archaeon CG10_big_fil_rev_8_21_14_0_10_30_7]|nr:MAG: hypothetical protein COV11_02120 [Candidatus Woesearchaeota archaeon CG10_big_fil_rev_8_21_14_0_10_30_7]